MYVFFQFQMHCQQVNIDLLCEVPGDSPNLRRTLESNCTECYPGLDLSTDCSTCEGESIQCVEGEQNCGVNTFPTHHYTNYHLFQSISRLGTSHFLPCFIPMRTPITCVQSVIRGWTQ